MERTHDLRLQLATSQSILYAYYLTADRESFDPQFIANFENLWDSYSQILRRILEAPGLNAMEDLLTDTLDMSNSSDQVIRAHNSLLAN